jgi:hypothetical protein
LSCALVDLQSVAAEALTYACNHCHKDALQQKTRILQFLIPVQMLLGKLPSAAIRQQHNMHMYDTIIQVRPEWHPRWICSTQQLPDLLFWEGTRLKRVGIVQGGFSVGPHC